MKRYVLSSTHLHEFKSADHIHTQQPVMSLCLLDQRLGSRSTPDASSHKFSLKGRQSGGIHRGHSWVFRAESYDTMMAWYEDIRNLTEKSGPEKNEYVRRHARSASAGSQSAPSISSDGVEDDEADEVPYAAKSPSKEVVETPTKRPSPGGRFPSDIDVNRNRDLRNASQSSGSSYQENVPMMSGALAQSRPDRSDMSGNLDGKDRASLVASTSAQHHLSSTTPPQSKPYQPSASMNEPMAAATVEESDFAKREMPASSLAREERPEDLETSVSDNVTEDASVELGDGVNRVDAPPLSEETVSSQGFPSHSGSIAPVVKEGEKSSGMRPTRFFPSVLRHNTDVSLEELHVPGEWINTTE